MTKRGYLKVMLATPKIKIGDPTLNVEPIVSLLNTTKASLVLFPELSITGYTSGDLFFQFDYLEKALQALKSIMDKTKFQGVYVLGIPLKVHDVLYNTAVVIQKDKILGVIPKYFLPNSKEFYEKRWFQSGLQTTIKEITLFGESVPFGKMIFTDNAHDISFGVEICQDMWAIQTPGDELSLAGAHMILNLSASTEHIGKPELRKMTVVDSSRKHNGAYLYTSNGYSESTSDVVYSSHKLVAVLGDIIAESTSLDAKDTLTVDIDLEAIRFQRRMDSTFRDEQQLRFKELPSIPVEFREVNEYHFENPLNQTPFLPSGPDALYQYKLANEIQVQSLMQKMMHLSKAKIVIGVSGGLDSALALLVAHQAITRLNRDPKDIIAVTMPSNVTSKATKSDAVMLMNGLGVTSLTIPIGKMLDVHLKALLHEHKEDITYENAQARIRTLNLMDIANQQGGFVLGTGDMSEIALGWMTFNGDHMSMYDINAGLTKTWVQALIKYHAEHEYHMLAKTLMNIYERPISPELTSNQSTEESIGKYEINDFILYHFLVHGASEEKCSWLIEKAFALPRETAYEYAKRFFERFYAQQFKRQPMPEGPKILKVSLSPRGELRLPSEIKRK